MGMNWHGGILISPCQFILFQEASILNGEIVKTFFYRVVHWIKNQLEDKRQKNNITALDGVRAIACLTVLDFHINLVTRDTHLWYSTDPSHMLISAIALSGASGVTLFFVLSGFLLFLPYAKALLFENNWPSTRQFYLRRVLRIIPGYYVALFAMILIIHPEYLQPDHLRDLGLFLTFFMDSTPQTFQQLNGPFWTLAVEWQFYMLLPLLAILFAFIVHGVERIGRSVLRRRVWTLTLCLLGLIGWGLFSRYWGIYFYNHPSETFLVPRPVLNVTMFFWYGYDGKFLEDFAIGMLVSLCFVYAQHRSFGQSFNRLMRWLSPWLWGAGILFLLFTAMWNFDQGYPHSWSFLNGLIPSYGWLSQGCIALGYGLCVAAILFGSAGLQWFFTLAPLRWLGQISYSLYMWHLPLLIFFMGHFGDQISAWGLPAYGLYLLWALLVVIPISFLLYVFVEKPFMKLSEGLRQKRTPPVPPIGKRQEERERVMAENRQEERIEVHAAP